jgi:hypothetical protein
MQAGNFGHRMWEVVENKVQIVPDLNFTVKLDEITAYSPHVCEV